MKILAFSAYYTPEIAASLYLTDDIYEGIVNAGNTVEVFVPMPTRGVSKSIRHEYKSKKLEKTLCDRLIIHRISMFREKKNNVLRAIRYLLVNLIFIWKGLITKADVIFVQSTPPTQGMMAGFISSIKKIPLIYNLQDIFPDSMVNSGMTKKGSFIWKIGRMIENYTYKNADRIIVISEDFKKNIMEKGVPKEKIEVVSNWVDVDNIRPIAKGANRLYDELGIDKNKFTVIYAGNFGASQGADIVVKAAEILKGQDDIQFIIFGGGSEYGGVKEYVNSKHIETIKLFDLLPPERVSEVYSLGDIAIITGKKGVGRSGMPSKTWSIMACNTPIVASFDTDSELSGILKQTGAGICIEPENATLLADAIMKAYKKEIGFSPNGRKYVCKNASKEKCVRKYIEVIEGLW